MTALPAAHVGSATQHGTPLTGTGTPTVTINGRPAWVSDIPHACAAHGDEVVGMGSETVLFNSKRAARAHGAEAGDFLQGAGPPDQIMVGSPNVLIGTPAIGIATPENVALFCQLYCQLKKDWPSLTPEQRQQRYEAMLGTMFATFGAPPPGTSQNLGPGAAASWDRGAWRINVASGAWTNPNGPPTAGDTFHEIRHGEQTFNAMRSVGGTGPRDALPAVRAAAAEQPLDPDSPVGRHGSLHASNEISKAGIENRNDIIREIHDAATADPTLSSQRWNDAVAGYHNQPGGADAGPVGRAGECKCP
jgi:uncharacterized Zn-binding protein involved in type VI secretion